MSESINGFGLLNEECALACRGNRARFPGDLFAWLGGARASVLRLCPGERSLYAGLGLGVLVTAIFGGMSAAFALSYVLHVAVRVLLPVAGFWALALANLDRLLLLITASKKQLLAMIPRLAVSALLGFLIAEPLTLRIFQPEITAQIAITQQQEQQAQLVSIGRAYQPKITVDENAVVALNRELLNDRATIDHYLLKKHVKQSSPGLPPSLRRNDGPYYRLYKRKAANARTYYEAVAPGIRSQILSLRGDISALRSEEVEAKRNIHAAIAGGVGWAAREAALDQLAARQAGIDLTVWLVRLAFLLVDLAPLIVKLLVVLFGKPVYDEIAAGVRDLSRVEAHRLREQARLERKKVTRRGDAQDEIDDAVVDADKEQKVAAAYAGGQPGGGPGAGSQQGSGAGSQQEKTREARIPALSLSQFAAESKVHERMAVPMAQPLSRLAWIGTGMLAALALALLLARSAAHVSVTGGWLALGALLASLALAAYSRGFRRGPAWAQHAAFGAGVLGLAVPALIIAMNV